MRLLVLASILLMSGVASAAPVVESSTAFADVPRGHFGYDAVQSLERSGIFTGYPKGTFSGKRLLTRYEFAVAVQRMAADLSRSAEPHATTPELQLRAAALDRLGRFRKPRPQELSRLADEFTPELALLGTTPEAVKEGALPDGTNPKPVSIPPELKRRSREFQRGQAEAQSQWNLSQVVLYSAGLGGSLFDEKLAVPIRYVAGCLISTEDRDRMEGHNSAVYRLILKHGPPPNQRLEWGNEIKDPAQFWAGNRAPKASAPRLGEFVVAPMGDLRARIRAVGGELPVLVEVERAGKLIASVGLGNARQEGPAPELSWAAGGELLFVRYATNANEGKGLGYLVYDTRAGTLVGRTYSNGPAN